MKRIGILWRGLAMGVADIIPGVSGGTIAFITGIYERLISGIQDVTRQGAKALREPRALKKIDWEFFIPLILGITLAFLAGSRVLPPLIQAYPGPVYGFFFGLILASAIVVYNRIPTHNAATISAGIIGIIIGAGIGMLEPAASTPSLWLIGLVGFVAASAMLLPGVSGSFILVLFGLYHYILTALQGFDAAILLAFALGAVLGLALLSHALGKLLQRWQHPTYAALAGLMLGALQRPVSIITADATPTRLAIALVLGVIGVALVLALEKNVTPQAQ